MSNTSKFVIQNGVLIKCQCTSDSPASVVIPEGVTTITSGTFEGCTSLASVVIPESVTTIYHSAFKGCTSLTSVVIPKSDRSHVVL